MPELNLISSPHYDDGQIVTDAVAGRTQTLFEVQREDSPVTGVLEFAGPNGKTNLIGATAPFGTEVGDPVFVSLTSPTFPDDPITGVFFIYDLAGVVISLNYPGSNDWTGYVNFLRQGVMIMTSTFDVDDGALPTYSVNYAIVYDRPHFKFDIHEYLELLFSQYQVSAFRYTNEVTAIMSTGEPVTGSALQTYTIDNFDSHLPKGYEFGQNLVGYIPNANRLGLFATDVKDGRLFEGFEPKVYTISDQLTPYNVRIWRTWKDVNGAVISNDDETVSLEYGINVVQNSLDWTPPANADRVDIFLTDIAAEPLTERLRLEVYCPIQNPMMVVWKNRLGAMDYWVFDREQEESIDYDGGIEYQDSTLEQLTVYSGASHLFNTRKFSTIRCNTRNLTQKQLKQLTAINLAEFVYISLDKDMATLVPVKQSGALNTGYRRGVENNYTFAMTFELPPDSDDVLSKIDYT